MHTEVYRRAERMMSMFNDHIGEPFVIFHEQGLKRLANALRVTSSSADHGPHRWWIGIAPYDVMLKKDKLWLSPSLYTRIVKKKTTGFRIRNGLVYYGAPPGDPMFVDESNVECRVGYSFTEPYDVDLRFESQPVLTEEQVAAFYPKAAYIERSMKEGKNWNRALHTSVAFGDDAGLLLVNPWKYQADKEKRIRPLREHVEEGRIVLDTLLQNLPTV
jgi:hypothetical protein